MPQFTIGMDAKRAVLNDTGLGNYSRYVVGALSAAYPDCSLRLYTPRVVENPRLAPLLLRPNVELVAPAGGGLLSRGALWRSWGMTGQLAADGVALYHGLSNELPLNIGRAGCASVVTIHDVIWRRVPGDYKPADRLLYDWKYGRSARAATRVIAISERTKADIVAEMGVEPEKIDVIYQGVDPIFRTRPDFEARERVRGLYGLPRDFVVQVGRVERRKNQLLTVRAMRALPADVKLVLIGRRRMPDYAAEIDACVSRYGLKDRVVWLDGVEFAHLPAIYAMARAVAYPSTYEGFGLPVAEALSVGTPVVAATGSCLEEAGGDGALYVAPDDADAMADALRSIVEREDVRDRLAKRGAAHVKRFDAEAFARATMACYRRALTDFINKL